LVQTKARRGAQRETAGAKKEAARFNFCPTTRLHIEEESPFHKSYMAKFHFFNRRLNERWNMILNILIAFLSDT
jgi:hypothetical protein